MSKHHYFFSAGAIYTHATVHLITNHFMAREIPEQYPFCQEYCGLLATSLGDGVINLPLQRPQNNLQRQGKNHIAKVASLYVLCHT